MPPKLAVSGVIGTPEPAQPSSISPQLPIKACPMRRCSRGNLCAPCFAGLQKFAKTVRVKLVHDSYDLEYFARFIGYGKRVDTRASPPKDIKSPVARELARRILSALATAEYPPALISLSIFCDQGMLDHEKDLGRAIEFAKRGAELGLADIESPRSVSVDQVSDTAFAIKTYFSYQADMESFGDRDIFGCIIFLERLHRLIKTVRGGPNDMKQLRHLLCVSSSNLAEVLIWQEKAHANLDISKARFDAYQRVIDSGSTTEEDQIRIADALFNQGCYCMEGFGGILSNPFKANELWLKAAKMGHLRACKNVATSFLLGDGLPKDEEKWKEWIDKAAQCEGAFEPEKNLNVD